MALTDYTLIRMLKKFFAGDPDKAGYGVFTGDYDQYNNLQVMQILREAIGLGEGSSTLLYLKWDDRAKTWAATSGSAEGLQDARILETPGTPPTGLNQICLADGIVYVSVTSGQTFAWLRLNPIATTSTLGLAKFPAAGGLAIDSNGQVICNAGAGLGLSGNAISVLTGAGLYIDGLGKVAANGGFEVLDGIPVNAIAAQGTITVSGTPVADETMHIGETLYTFKALRSGAGEITISAVNATQATNIINAITADSTDVTAANGTASTVVVTAKVRGVSGNNLTFTESVTGIAMNGSNKLGGTTLGVSGTVAPAKTSYSSGLYFYHTPVKNTIADANWLRFLGATYVGSGGS